MSISNYIRRTDEEDARPNETRRNGRVDPTVLLERSFLQWNMIDSIANAVVGWAIVCTILFLISPAATILSVSGAIFFITGLVVFGNIFGVMLYITNYFIMVWQKKVHPPFPDLRHLKKLGWVANIVWFGILFFTAKYSFDLMYSLIQSIVQP